MVYGGYVRKFEKLTANGDCICFMLYFPGKILRLQAPETDGRTVEYWFMSMRSYGMLQHRMLP